MRTRWICALTLLALAGCGWRANFKPRNVDLHSLSEEEKHAAYDQYLRDWSDCTERGYALQTYSGSWSAYQGTGGGYSGTQFNQPVFVNCMQARGYNYEGRTPTIFGKALW
jgi:hypothetical protein